MLVSISFALCAWPACACARAYSLSSAIAPICLLWRMAGRVPREKKKGNFLASTHDLLPKFFCPKHAHIFARKTIPGAR